MAILADHRTEPARPCPNTGPTCRSERPLLYLFVDLACAPVPTVRAASAAKVMACRVNCMVVSVQRNV